MFSLKVRTKSKSPVSGPARRRGTVAVLVSMGMVMFLGFCALAVDYGLLVADANKAQRACDAAALAGVIELKKGKGAVFQSQARKEAQDVAGFNGVVIPNNRRNIDITFPTDTRIRVVGSLSRNTIFARLLGYRTASVTRSATAQVASCNQLTTNRVVPIGITTDTFDAYSKDTNPRNPSYHTITLIRANKTLLAKDDFALFDLRDNNGKSPAKMADQVTGAEQETSHVGDYENTINASDNSQMGHFEPAMNTLFTRSSAAPWNEPSTVNPGEQYPVGQDYPDILNGISPRDAQGNPNPRIMYLIVTPPPPAVVNGTFNTLVQNFAPVYVRRMIETTDNQGNTILTLDVGFLPQSFISDGSCGVAPDGTPLAGTAVVSLVQ